MDRTRSRDRSRRPAFTLIEILVVLVVISILVGLLTPALIGAYRSSIVAAQQAEYETLTQALTNFKVDYGMYPPSRVVLDERGDYSPAHFQQSLPPADAATAVRETTRSLVALRSLAPRCRFDVSGPTPSQQIPGGYYDFNRNGRYDAVPVILSGDEALVFFLSGVGKDAQNPWKPDATEPPARYEFRPGSLVDFDGDGWPSLADQIGGRPVAYFSTTVSGYDPSDCDDPSEPSETFALVTRLVTSPGPNPYTDGAPDPTNGKLARWHRSTSFQLISPGVDGRFGPGGQYDPTDAAVTSLPVATEGARDEERDNVTNFHRGVMGK